MKQIYHILIIAVAFLLPLAASGEEVTFQASAPTQVVLGQPFHLTYSVNQQSKDLRAPELEHFDILAGPYTSSSRSTQWINGKRTSSFSQTYTYTLCANKEGTFSIHPATIVIDKQTYTSNGLKITVLPPNKTGTSSEQNNNNAGRSDNTASATNVSSDNIFIRTIAGKTHVQEQECILLSYKLYFAGVDVTQFTNNTKLPEYKGFLKQDLELGEIQTELEHYNGRNYQTAILYQTLLYPQHSGTINIEPASFEAILRVQNKAQARSIFDDFFGSYTNVAKNITAPGITINVSALPAGKPTGFSGGVGKFRINSSITATELQTNDAVTIKIEISGTGNLKLLKTPSIDWPEGFEVYDPKVTNNFKNTTAGVSGTKTIEYLAIPRAAGDFVIPPLDFSYYDTQERAYKTLSTPEYSLHVKRGADDQTTVTSDFVSKEDIKQIGTDIRYIYTGELPNAARTTISFGTWAFRGLYLIPFLLTVIVFIVFRRRLKENADLQRVHYKKANKVTQRRLRQAKKLLADNKKEAFYEEIERAAWTYLSYRLSIPTAQLNKENIAQILQEKGIGENIIQEVHNVLSTAEFARYAPSGSEHQMQDIYQQTATLINRLENCNL
ncbi:MAG: BatD family protein [Paludibacter sp.]|nr:BatD family protein [Bacteroidales bacterium]MCM1068918.1 BatD family protein [Prevotella sp.]MCM1353179.1 BatD family protein [Bacteroides sp.]MCM1442501.1 BatD family protein [Muribaculum sp.]MCM1481344.1 BatD family protein [Paludibacter sp.]